MGTLFRFRSKKQLIESFGFSRTSSGFTLLETIIVLVILTILTVPAFINSSTSLEEARDQLIADIRYTQNLALLNSKFQSVPTIVEGSEEANITEKRRTKFWFKSRWQIYITNTGDSIYYSIFSDSATDNSASFDKRTAAIKYSYELLTDHFEKTGMSGTYKEISSNSAVYKEDSTSTTNLSDSYRVTKFEIDNSEYTISAMSSNLGDRLRLIFDYLGRPYFNYDKNDNGDYNPFTYGDSNKNSLIRNSFQIKLWKKDDYLCLTIEGLTGLVYADSCKF